MQQQISTSRANAGKSFNLSRSELSAAMHNHPDAGRVELRVCLRQVSWMLT